MGNSWPSSGRGSADQRPSTSHRCTASWAANRHKADLAGALSIKWCLLTPSKNYFYSEDWFRVRTPPIVHMNWFWSIRCHDCAGDARVNDQWLFSPDKRTWAWVGGSNKTGSKGQYGVIGVPSASNSPGARSEHAMVASSKSGLVYLFGGYGYDAFKQGLPMIKIPKRALLIA